MNLLGALPARFRRERVLIVGCGDVGLRAARELGSGRRARLLALSSSAQRQPELRRDGITPLLGDLDQAPTLRRLGALVDLMRRETAQLLADARALDDAGAALLVL